MRRPLVKLATAFGLTLAASSILGQARDVDRVAIAVPTQPAEQAYVAAIHTLLDRGKRYPTGREASLTRPNGAAEVWFVLSRSGEVRSLGLERSSGSVLLDAMARSLVRRAGYPAFPVDAWQGATSRRFAVRYAFGEQQRLVVDALNPDPAGP